MAKIGFIGMGNMGTAMLYGALKVFQPDELIFTQLNMQNAEKMSRKTGVPYVESNAECANQAKCVVLAVKPQYYDEVIKKIKYIIKEDQIIISIAPGFTIEQLREKFGGTARVVRAMPNTPALIGEGMTGVSYCPEEFTFEERELLKKFFSSFGRVEIIEERLMSSVICASGSSPAYVYLFIEALADSAVKYGMPREKAYEFAAQAVRGAASMVLETKKHPGELKDQVCSPGGTTIAGVTALEEFGFRNAVIKANDACFTKSQTIT